MASVIAAGKKVWIALYTVLTLAQVSVLGQFVTKWADHWVSNRSKIITLTSINTGITFTTEFISRTVLSVNHSGDNGYKFVVGKGPWYKNINRQSLINIWMTFFASLIGAPVYFFRRRSYRFMFFVGFGTFNSLLSQSVISLMREGFLQIAIKRLSFDFFYNGTVKYILFEFFRKPIKNNGNFFKLAFLRGKQDLLTSFFKTGLLNYFKFKG